MRLNGKAIAIVVRKSAVEMLNFDYLLGLAKAVFGFDEDRPLWKRKETLEKFLVESYSNFILE
jgi:hypothetical protein